MPLCNRGHFGYELTRRMRRFPPRNPSLTSPIMRHLKRFKFPGHSLNTWPMCGLVRFVLQCFTLALEAAFLVDRGENNANVVELVVGYLVAR